MVKNELAEEIGSKLCQNAEWKDDRCNWHKIDKASKQLAPLGPDLYSGGSGIALFLAELAHGTTDVKDAGKTALGAIKNSLYQAERSQIGLGLYTGLFGIAIAAVRIASILDEPHLLARAKRLLPTYSIKDTFEPDIISGKAGMLVAALVLRPGLNETWLLKFVRQMGDYLIRSAEKSRIGWSWKLRAMSFPRNLTGFSHGAAGIAYALLELFQATGDQKYEAAAAQAFRYERHWFNERLGNWPDLRYEINQNQFMCSWCHGAPGIALSRLRAYEILKAEACRDEALIGLKTTRLKVEEQLSDAKAKMSLCCGLAGRSEILSEGDSILKRSNLNPKTADRVRAALDGYCSGRGRLNSDPGLMQGLAGVGYFCLRLQDHTHPSVLLLRTPHTS